MQSVKKLVEDLLGSDIKADLLMLFHQNPRLIDNLEGIAIRIGRTSEAIEKDVLDLVRLGLLQMNPLRHGEAISLNREHDRKFQKTIADYILALK